MPTLLDPITVGDLRLPNRVWMAPLTRCRADEGRVPNAMMAEYYAQRASAGLILSEATSVTPMGVGYPDTPGIWSDEQVAGWRITTDAVHAAGGIIFLQLWHVGRISDPIYLDGQTPVSASAIAAPGFVSRVRPQQHFVVPRALDIGEIPAIVESYRLGAVNAKTAGFDGVEIHGANGYLPEQFLLPASNQRTDAYGGSVENRARFLLEVVDAAIGVWGPGRVGVHLSPRPGHDWPEGETAGTTYEHVARELDRRGIAFICARELVSESARLGHTIRNAYKGTFIANEALTRETGQHLLDAGDADAVAFGRLFIANPDLPERFAQHAALNVPDIDTFYTPGPQGYTDYPRLAESRVTK